MLLVVLLELDTTGILYDNVSDVARVTISRIDFFVNVMPWSGTVTVCFTSTR